MRRSLLTNVATLVALATSTIGILGTLSQPVQAQIFPDKTFGCSAPGAGEREYPVGIGNAYNNALISTPTAPTVVPTQADIAIFTRDSSSGLWGQERCVAVASRLNQLNTIPSGTPLEPAFVRVGGNRFAICLRAVGTGAVGCPGMIDPTAIAAPLPAPGPTTSYLVMTFVNGRTTPEAVVPTLIGTLNGTFRSAPNTYPYRD